MRDFRIRPGIRRLFRLPLSPGARARADADAELDTFIEAQIEHLVSRGVPVAEAREQVLQNLGAPLQDVRRGHHQAIEVIPKLVGGGVAVAAADPDLKPDVLIEREGKNRPWAR